MNSKKNFISLSSDKIVNKINDLTIGEDSTDYLTVNSETRFHSDVNIGGSSIKLRSTDDTNDNNFIEIMGERLHSTHVKTIRSINNNKIDGDLTIGEDDTDMLTIASKLHIPGGESGQVLTKGTDGSIEYGPTAFDSVNLPGMSNSEHLLCRNTTTTPQTFATNTDSYFTFNTVTDENGNPSNTNGTITLANGNKTLFQNKSGHTLTYVIDLFSGIINENATYFELWANVNSDINTIPDRRTSSKNRLHMHVNSDEPGRVSFNCMISVPNNYYLHILGRATSNSIGIGCNLSNRHDLYFTIDIVALYNRSNTFTTANPLLANPSTADKGKIVTVNAAGDDLEYGANFKELACKQTIITNALIISQANVLDKWADLASHNTNNNIHLQMNTETKINVSQNSKVEIKAQISVSHANNSNLHVAIRLGKKVGNTIIWGNSTGTIAQDDTTDEAQTDPKGDVDGDKHPVWRSVNSSQKYDGEPENYLLLNLDASYIDEDPTNGLSGYHDVTYFIRILKLYDSTDLYIGTPNASGDSRTTVPTILSATEIGSGAITSFTQEQALAGAGGTAAFTAYTSSESSGGHQKEKIHDDIIYADTNSWATVSGTSFPHTISYEFNTPQIVTKYRIWPRQTAAADQMIRNWELRGATDKSTYDSGTYTILNSQSLQGTVNATGALIGWPTISSITSSTTKASNFPNLANEYNLSTIGAYKYYLLYITANYGNSNYTAINEWALYGGGFTIPSQVGNTGRLLTTDGTSLGWSTTSALPSVTVPEPTSTNKGRALVSTGTGIEFSDFNSGVSTGFKVYKSGTAFEEVTTNTAVLFDQTTTNVGAGSYSTTAGTYTVPVTGYYNIFANFTIPTVSFCARGSVTRQTSGDITCFNDVTSTTADPGLHNIGGGYDTSNGVFTAPVSGIYQFSLQGFNYQNENLMMDISIYYEGAWRNNQLRFERGDHDEGYESLHVPYSYLLRKGEKIKWILVGGSFHANANYSKYSGYLVTATGIDYRIQKSTNSGTTYTDLATSSDKPTTSIVESLNQNDLIRVISGDGSTGSTLNFEQGSTKNSFGAHLLNSGNSTSPIPIYGFNANLNSDHPTGTNSIIDDWRIDKSNHYALPTANFSASSGIYTIPVSGYYQINIIVRITSFTSENRIYISINNNTIDYDNSPGAIIFKSGYNNDSNGSFSTVIKLNINDTICLKTTANSGTIQNDDTHWSCFLLASDTQTNTRQMGLSPIVPLHQLGHDQFAEGVVCRVDVVNSENQNVHIEVPDGQDAVTHTVADMGTITPGTVYKLSSYNDGSNYAISYIRNGGSASYTVPSPVWSDSNWTDSTSYILIKPQLTSNVGDTFYTIGSVTIDASKLLENYIGWWLIRVIHDDACRLKVNNESLGFFGNSTTGGDERSFNLFQKYINIEYMHREGGSGDLFYFEIYRAASVPGLEIAEPVMPSITLPTPTSNNNGKVLVSNGSGYALENSGARNQTYISIYGLTAAMNISGIKKIEGWNVNNLINIGSGFTFSDADDTITIKNVGYYKIKANITFYITTGGTNNERSLKVQIYINDSAVGPPMMGNLIHAEGGNNYATVPCEYIAHITSINSVIDIRVGSSSNNAADVFEQTPYWSIEDMTPSAVPSINVPLPVAAHAGKALTVNSAGTGLEYDNLNIIKDSYLTEEYGGGNTAFTDSGDNSYTITHNLGYKPYIISIFMRCVSSVYGYAVGDEILVSPSMDGDGARNFGTEITTTQIIFRGDYVHYTRKDDFSNVFAMNSSRWDFYVKILRVR